VAILCQHLARRYCGYLRFRPRVWAVHDRRLAKRRYWAKPRPPNLAASSTTSGNWAGGVCWSLSPRWASHGERESLQQFLVWWSAANSAAGTAGPCGLLSWVLRRVLPP